MWKIAPISIANFKKRYKTPEIEPKVLELFTFGDLDFLEQFEQINFSQKFISLPGNVVFSLKHPRFINSFIIPRIVNFLSYRIRGIKKTTFSYIKDIPIVKNALMKAMIAASFRPTSLLEIGTYLGVGSATFKKVMPDCMVFTINPKESKEANNPIKQKYIGAFYKRKKLTISQIWADSTSFDFATLPEIDVCFIDGNHKYEYIYKDLENAAKITKKCIFLDDYVPQDFGNKMGLVYGPWNESVVKATDDFLRKNPNEFKKTYWITYTKYCVLVK